MSTAAGVDWRSKSRTEALSSSSSYGFSLIEVLVVMLIMGLLIGLVAFIARPNDRDQLHVEAERLARLLDLAVDESRFTGNAIAWTADGTAYRFWRYREGTGWLEIRDNNLLRARILPHGMEISDLWVEATRRQDVMRLEFSPYPPSLAFTVMMSLGVERTTISGSPLGEVRVLPGDGRTNGALALR